MDECEYWLLDTGAETRAMAAEDVEQLICFCRE